MQVVRRDASKQLRKFRRGQGLENHPTVFDTNVQLRAFGDQRVLCDAAWNPYTETVSPFADCDTHSASEDERILPQMMVTN
jgi:hypothetical protein